MTGTEHIYGVVNFDLGRSKTHTGDNQQDARFAVRRNVDLILVVLPPTRREVVYPAYYAFPCLAARGLQVAPDNRQ